MTDTDKIIQWLDTWDTDTLFELDYDKLMIEMHNQGKSCPVHKRTVSGILGKFLSRDLKHLLISGNKNTRIYTLSGYIPNRTIISISCDRKWMCYAYMYLGFREALWEHI